MTAGTTEGKPTGKVKLMGALTGLWLRSSSKTTCHAFQLLSFEHCANATRALACLQLTNDNLSEEQSCLHEITKCMPRQQEVTGRQADRQTDRRTDVMQIYIKWPVLKKDMKSVILTVKLGQKGGPCLDCSSGESPPPSIL
jgi:hypothetical protein